MNARTSIVPGWILALPGLAMLLSLLLVATPIFGIVGWRILVAVRKRRAAEG